MLLDAGADVNARDRFSSVFKTASKKGMRAFDGKNDLKASNILVPG